MYLGCFTNPAGQPPPYQILQYYDTFSVLRQCFSELNIVVPIFPYWYPKSVIYTACSLVGFWAGLGWLVLVCCERKTPLGNIYAQAKKWDKVKGLRKMMAERGLSKTPGSSWVHVA